MTLRFRTLFSVEILHDFYVNRRCPDFEIIPSLETASIMKGHKLISKVIGNKLFVLMDSTSEDKATIPLSPNVRLAFFMKLKNERFFNFTNLSYSPWEATCFYLSNENETEANSILYLNSSIRPYNSANDYVISELVSTDSGNVYEAIQPSGSTSPHSVTDKTYWVAKGKVQHVTPADLIEMSPGIYRFGGISDTSFTVNVFGLNASTGVYDKQVLDTVNENFSTSQTILPVHLEKLPDGKYRIDVNGQSKLVYKNTAVLYDKIFGLIEISNHLPASSAFSLFDSSGVLKSPAFTVSFASRSVIWKFIARTADITSVSDSRPAPDKIVFTPLSNNQFISTRPIQSSEAPIKTLSIESTAHGNIAAIGNPGTERLSKIEVNGNAYYSAEKHLNY